MSPYKNMESVRLKQFHFLCLVALLDIGECIR